MWLLLIKKLVSDESGMATAEYALLLAFIGLLVAAAAFGLGDAVGARMTEAEGQVE